MPPLNGSLRPGQPTCSVDSTSAGPFTGMLTPSSRLDSSGVARDAAAAPAACGMAWQRTGWPGRQRKGFNWVRTVWSSVVQQPTSAGLIGCVLGGRLLSMLPLLTCCHHNVQRHIRPRKVADHCRRAAAGAAADQQQACRGGRAGEGSACRRRCMQRTVACIGQASSRPALAQRHSPTAYSGGRPSSCTSRSASEGSTAYCRARPSSTQPGERSTRLTSCGERGRTGPRERARLQQRRQQRTAGCQENRQPAELNSRVLAAGRVRLR